MRRIVAFIDADEDMLLEHHPEDGVGVAFETEMGWVEKSGIHVMEWAISDADDTEAYARYLHYLFITMPSGLTYIQTANTHYYLHPPVREGTAKGYGHKE